MVVLREVKVKENVHYYLYHVVKNKRYKKYLGTDRPKGEKLKKLKKDFIEDIKKGRTSIECREAALEKLQEIQEKNNYISENDVVRISKEMCVPAVQLYGVITFYSQFKLVKPGKHTLSICTGTACHVKKSDGLLKYLEEKLGIKSGNTTKDGLLTLQSVNCIGACAKAPAMMLDGEVYGNLTREKIDKILSRLK